MSLSDPILSKNKKIILQNFGQLVFLSIYNFLLFLKKENNQNITNLITKKNNQNQEAFIVIIINYKLINKIVLCGFSSVFAMQNIIFLKIATLRIKYYFYFTNRPTLFFFFFFFAVLLVGQKNNLVSHHAILVVISDILRQNEIFH